MEALARVWSWFGFGGKETPRSAQEHSRINYSPELIPALKGDHGELLSLYRDIEKMAVHGGYAGIPAALGSFKSKLDVHLLNENLHFYCYIEEKAQDPQDKELIKGFRSEMNALARGVVNFIKTHRQAGVHPANAQSFLTELRQVGALLVRRIEREEKQLYTLYRA
jgi:hypothetical protein